MNYQGGIMKRNSKKILKLILIIFSVIIIFGICLYIYYRKKANININLKDVNIELGSEISSDIKDYVKGNTDKYNKISLNTEKIEDKVGTYKYIIEVTNKILFNDVTKVFCGNIAVVDTTSPNLILKDLSIIKGENIDINNFVESCTDLSNCKVRYKDEEYINSIKNIPGKYEIVIVGVDDYNNEIEKTINLEIKEKKVETKKNNTNTKSSNSNSKNGIAVLNYHFTINEEEASLCSPSSICMNENLFEEHIKYIKDNGFYTATLNELEDYIDGKISLPKKTVVITIDDGWFVARAKTIIEKYNVKATLFLIGSLAPVSDYKSSNLDVHSHTWNLHGEWGALINADDNTILEDLSKSRASLNNTTYFCYPFYQYDDRVISLLKQSGFTMAFAGGDTKVKVGTYKYVVPRYIINGDTSVQSLAGIIN